MGLRVWGNSNLYFHWECSPFGKNRKNNRQGLENEKMLHFTKVIGDYIYKINKLTKTWLIHNFKNLLTAQKAK